MFSDLQTEGYIYPYTSFGFKLLFKSEPNKELFISFVKCPHPNGRITSTV